MPKRINIRGERYGQLVVIEQAKSHRQPNGRTVTRWLCQCDCGNKTVVATGNLRYNKQQSCSFTCGFSKYRKNALRHSYHPLYSTWSGMKSRCYSTNSAQYKDYGGRGIKICNEWLNDFTAFRDWAEANGWFKGSSLEIERKDNDGDYTPFNCEWVTHRQNSLNKRILRSTNTSGYEGVSKDSRNKNKYRARICVNGTDFHIGTYSSSAEAVTARNEWIIKNNLEDQYRIQLVQKAQDERYY